MTNGSTCPNRWLDSATVPCLVWLMSVRFYQPDIFIHECVPAFPSTIFQTVLNDTSGTQMKNVYAVDRPEFSLMLPGKSAGHAGDYDDSPSDDLVLPEWALCTKFFSPEDLGVPHRRQRCYTAGVWKPRFPSLNFGLVHFEHEFFRTLELSAKVFFEVDPAMASQGSRPMISAQANRLETHLVRAAEKGLCNQDFSEWRVPVAVVNLLQSNAWAAISTTSLPSLLRKGRLWDLTSGAEVGEVSVWLAQGFPHPLAGGLPDCLRADFSFKCCHDESSASGSVPDLAVARGGGGSSPKDLASGARSRLRVGAPQVHHGFKLSDRLSLVGNAMNLWQVTAVLVFAFSCVGSPDTDSKSGGSCGGNS